MDRALHELLAALEGSEWDGADFNGASGQLDHVRAEKIALAYANASSAQNGRTAVRAVLNQQPGTLSNYRIFVVSSQRFKDLKKERRFCKAGVIVLTDDTATVEGDLHAHVADLPKGVYALEVGGLGQEDQSSAPEPDLERSERSLGGIQRRGVEGKTVAHRVNRPPHSYLHGNSAT